MTSFTLRFACASLALFLALSCSEKSDDASSRAEGSETPGASATPVAAEPPPELVAIAFRDDSREVHLRPGMLLRSPEAFGNAETVVALRVPAEANESSFHFWHEKRGVWRSVRLRAKAGDLAFFGGSSLPAPPEDPPRDGDAAVGWTYEWGDALDPDADSRDSEREREILDLRTRYLEALARDKEIRDRFGRAPTNRRAPPRSRQEHFELREELDEVRRGIAELKREADRLGISLGQPAADHPAPPERGVAAVSRGLPADAPVLVPGRGLTRAEGELLDLEAIRAATRPRIEQVEAHFKQNRGNPDWTLVCTARVERGLAHAFAFGVAFAPASAPAPETPEVSREYRHGYDGNPLRLELEPGAGNSAERALYFYHRTAGDQPWIASDPVRLRAPADARPPRLLEASVFEFRAPGPEPAEDLVPVADSRELDIGGRILGAALGGGGSFAGLVRDDPGGVILASVEPLEKVRTIPAEGDPRSVRVAADRHRLFVVDRDGTRLRSFSPDAPEPLVERTFPRPVLALGAGASGEGAILAVLRERLRLLDPATLESAREWITPQPRERSFPETGTLDPWILRGANPAGPFSVVAAPDGSSFKIIGTPPTPGHSEPTWQLLHEPRAGLWKSRDTLGEPHWHGNLLRRRTVQMGESRQSLSFPDSLGTHRLVPTAGRGVLGWQPPRERTVPPTPVRLNWIAPDPEAPMISFEGGLPAFAADPEAPALLWFDPTRLTLLSAGESVLRLESLERAVWNTRIDGARQVANLVPPARPGRTWRFEPTLADDSPAVRTTVESDPPFDLSWEDGHLTGRAPSDLEAGFVKVTAGGGDDAYRFDIPVRPATSPQWSFPGTDRPPEPAASAEIPVTGPVRQILVAGGGKWLAIVSGQHTRLTVVDLKRSEVVGRTTFHDGPTEIFEFGDELLCWSRIRGTLVRRRLPDLTPVPPAGALDPLWIDEVLTYRGPAGPAIRAIGRDENFRLALGEVDPATLGYTNSALFEAVRRRHASGNPSLLGVASISADDGAIFVAGHLIRKKEGNGFEATPVREVRSDAAAMLSRDGSYLFTDHRRLDLVGGRTWSPPDSTPHTKALVPARAGHDFVVCDKSPRADASPSIVVYDGETLAPRFELKPLAGFSVPPELREALPDPGPGARRLILDSDLGLLIVPDAIRSSVRVFHLPGS